MIQNNNYRHLPRFISILFFVLLSSSLVRGDGYHNSTKKFTAPNEMSQKDWTDPLEIKKTWNAALVRIPNGTKGILKANIKKTESNQDTETKKIPYRDLSTWMLWSVEGDIHENRLSG